MARQGSGFARHALHEVPISANCIDVVMEDLKARLVEIFRQPFSGNRHAHAVSRTLSQRPGGGFHSRGNMRLGMSGSLAVDLPEALDLFHGDGKILRNFISLIDGANTGKVKRGVEQHGRMARGKDKAVAVGPCGVLGVVAQEALPEGIDHRRKPHWCAGMAGVGQLNGVDRQSTDGIDAQLVEVQLNFRLGHLISCASLSKPRGLWSGFRCAAIRDG